MERLDNNGVSDILVIAAMFIILILIAMLIHGYINLGLQEASNRRNELKASYLRETLNKSPVKPYSTTGIKASAKYLAVKNPTIDNEYLHSWYENMIKKLKPPDFGVKVVVTGENRKWRHTTPENIILDNKNLENYTSTGFITITKVGGEIETFDVKVCLFEFN